MHVTRAHLEDISRAAPLFAAYREWYGQPYDLDAATAFLAERIKLDESVVLLASNGEGPVGFAQIYPTFSSTRLARIWILNDLFIAEEARGSGAVDALLKVAALLAEEAGAIAVELATAHTNLRAQAVYVRHGYVLDETFQHYEKPLTEKPLTAPIDT